MKTVIETQKLTREYQMGDSVLQALKGIDLQVQSGEFIALMGPSGSGKSTLLHLLGCLDRPSAGSYILEGQNVSELNDDQRAYVRSHNIGFVFQSFNLLPRMTALENVAMPLFYRSDPGDWSRAAHDALVRVGLEKRMHHLPTQLSGGERQRVAIARALVNRPKILLADEPTGNLDSARGKEIMSLLKDLVAEGLTLVMVTHDNHCAAYADRLVILKDGELLKEGVI